MDWGSVLSTAVGAAIGITATVIADRNRWHRELSSRALDVRRETYTSFMTAMNDAGEAIRSVSLGDQPSEAARDSVTREAFRSSGVHAALERLRLVAPPNVETAADEVFRSMRRLRDHYADGKEPADIEAHAVRMKLEEDFKVLRGLMRTDLATEND